MLEEQDEPPLLRDPRSPFILVADTETLKSAVENLSALPGPVAIDAERASGFKYFPRAYLLQFYKKGGPIFLVDPTAFGKDGANELATLAKAIQDDEWILHAATQDLPCLAELGFMPKRLFDTELAARLLNLERVGLGSLCENLLNFRLAKEHSAVDWSTRPLVPEWLTYAALDVDVLHELQKELQSRLEAENKTDWASEEFRSLVDFKPRVKDGERWRSTAGIHTVREPKKLSTVKALWLARDDLARRLDVSPGRLLPDKSMIEAAIQSPKSRSELVANKAFVGRASRSYADLWWKSIQASYSEAEHPPVRIVTGNTPNHRFWKEKFPDAFARLEICKSLVKEIATDLNVPQENLVSPEVLREICWLGGTPDLEEMSRKLQSFGARAWQVGLLAEHLVRAFRNSANPGLDQH